MPSASSRSSLGSLFSGSSRSSRSSLGSLFSGSSRSSRSSRSMLRALSLASSRRTPLVAFAALALFAAPGCAASGEEKDPGGADGATDDGGTDTASGDDANPADAPSDSSVGDGTPADGDPADGAIGDSAPGDAGGETCPTSCTVGDKSCDGNAVRTCETQGSCAGFGAKLDCPATQVRSAGKCSCSTRRT